MNASLVSVPVSFNSKRVKFCPELLLLFDRLIWKFSLYFTWYVIPNPAVPLFPVRLVWQE
ncbi:hypothetical protein B1H10_07710 [candidate division KSB1 bacterium 4484_188]|nr:MAG: hypothetical protein B1H10_07710 [candidate division KSB1 bacterium 4484_188]